MDERDIDLIADELKDSNLTSSGEIKEMKNNILQKMLFDKDELKILLKRIHQKTRIQKLRF